MPNNNVAILSIMSKFDEKSAREAAKRADKVYEEALSDIGNVNFDKKLIENFDKAMNLLKNKFKKVNLSSYTNSLLDSIFSDKDIKEKSKDIESFISKIEMLKKASSGQDINAFNTFSAKQIDALISRTEKLAEKQEEINEKTREYSREATKIAKSNRSISTIDKNYGNQDYSKTLGSLKKSLGTEREFTAEQNQSIENLAKMVNLYQTMEKSEPQKGTAEAIRYSKDLLAVTQKIKEERDKIDAFSKKGASTYITNNGLSSIDKVSDYTVSKSKEDFVKASLSNLKSQEAKLQSELTTYISESVQKNLAKVSKEVDAVVDKAEKRVENLQNKIDSLQSKPSNAESNNSVIGNIVSDSDIKSLEEIEDRLYAISDLDAEGEATKQQLKEYIQLYKQYEQLIANDSTVKFDPGLKDEYDSIVESDSKLKKYADTLDETISKQKELNAVKSNENEVSVDKQTEQLVKQEGQIKETIQAEKQLQDTQEKISSNTKIYVDAEQAIADINKIKESLDSIPEEKNIKITISDSDYTNTPLLSDAEGNTITAFRGVVGAWSGLINQDGIGFFTDKLKLAADYADSLAESGKVYQANLSFKNPLEVEGNGAKWDEIDFNGVKKTTDEIVELAKQLGHDGVIFKNIRDGFTDTDEDISNVMVALNAAQIKNEQVIGTVKAGTGEMVDVASKIDNATDTATNSTVESQNKIQEELKETQKIAKQVSEAMNNVGSDKSNISSENSIVEGQNKIQEELKETQENSTITNNSLQNDAKETAKNIHYVTNALGEVTVAYRGLRDTMAAGLSSDRYHGGTFWTDNLELAKEYSQWTKVESANLEMLNPLEIEGNGSNWNNIEWLGHNSDEASRKIIKARKDIDSLRESIKYLGYDVSKINLTDNDKSGFASYETVIDALSNRMSDVAEAAENTKEYIASIKGEEFAKNYEDPILKVAIEELNLFTDAVKRYREVALDDSNTYGLFDTNKFVELAKKSGYDGVIFKNIIDSYSGDVRDISNVMVTFEQNQTHFLETISVDPVERIRANFKSVYGDISELAEKSKEEYSEIFRQMDSIETNFKNGNIDKKERANSLKKIYQENPEIPSFFNYLNQNAFATSFNEALDNSNFDEQANLILDFIRTAKNDWEALEKSVSNGKLDFEKVNSLVTEFGFNDIVNDYISKIQSLPEIEKQARRGLIDFSNVDDMEKNISEIEAVYPILSKFKEQLVNISSAEEDVGEKAKLISDIYQDYLGDFNNKWNSFDTETPIKDVFQGDTEKSGMDNIASATEEAVQAKKDFATANEGVQSSVDGSKSKLELEAELMNQIAKSAREAADAKKEFVKANKEVKASAESSNNETKKYNTEENANAWKELSYSIQRYSEVSKRISSGNVLEGDVEELERLENKISQLQKLDVLSPTQIEKSEQMLVKLYDKLDDIEKKAQKTKKESLESDVKWYNDDFEKKNAKPSNDNRSAEYTQKLAEYKSLIEQLETISKLDIINENDIKDADALKEKLKSCVNELNSFSASQKGSTPLSRGKTIEWANDLLKQNTKWSKAAKIEVQGWIDKLATADPSNVEEIRNEILKIVRLEREAGNEGRTWLDIFKDKKLYSFLGQAASMFSFYDLIRYVKEGTSAVKEFDDGLTKISYTMDVAKSQLDDLGQSVLDMASDMKTSLDDAMSVAQIYANMNTTAEEIQKLSEPTLILSNLTGFDASTVADDIQAVTQQFDILAEDSMHIADVYDYISRNISVDYSKGIESIAEAVQVAGSTAKQAGLEYEQLAAIVGKTAEKTRLEGSQIGNGLKTIMTRLSKVGELSDEVDNETMSDASESLHKIGVEVYNADGSFRQFDVIMGELANKWSDLTDAEKSNISFAIAATRQTNLLSAVLSNFSDSMQLAEEATNANGSALENQQKYMDSFAGHLQSLETEAKIAWINILDSETLKGGVDLLTGLVKVVGQLVDKFGLLGAAGLVGGGILAKNGIG